MCLHIVSVVFSYCHFVCSFYFFFFKQKTAYEMRIGDWSSDVCSSDLIIMEALILPKAIQLRIDRSLSGPSPAKLCDIGMVDLIFGERRGKNVEIVLRVGAGPWDRAHIDELSDLRGA